MSTNFVFFQHDDYGSSNRVLLTSYRLRNQSLAIFWGNEDTRTLFGVLSLKKNEVSLDGGINKVGKNAGYLRGFQVRVRYDDPLPLPPTCGSGRKF